MKKLLLAAVFCAAQSVFGQDHSYVSSVITTSAGTNATLRSLTTNTVTCVIDLSREQAVLVGGSFYTGAANTNYAVGTGNLVFIASNSLDHATWFADPARNFTVPIVSGQNQFQTNFSGLAYPYLMFGLGNTSTNAHLNSERFISGVKTGF